MIRVLITLAVLLLLVGGVVWVSEQPGAVSATWFGWRIETSAAVAVFGLLIAGGVLGLLFLFLRTLWVSPRRVGRYFRRKREESGYEALSRGLVAVAAGDGKAADRFARIAERKLEQPALTRLLNAQAAQLNGDDARAERYFDAMAKESQTELLGLRGLIVQALRKGDKQLARDLAEKARARAPRTAWAHTTLFDLETDLGDWANARRTLVEQRRVKLIDKGTATRREAVLTLVQARDAANGGRLEDARALAVDAAKAAPGLVPAAALAARLLGDAGDQRKAAKILRAAWAQAPHPDLATACMGLVPDEETASRRKRVEKMLAAAPDHAESRLTRAELAIAAEDWTAAREALSGLDTAEADARVCTLMATVAKGGGEDEAIVRAWLARALTAPRGPQWVCESCGHIPARWEAVCASCGAFDTLAWRPAAGAETSLALPPAVLPLLTAADESATQEPAAGAVEEVPVAEPVPEAAAPEAPSAAPEPARPKPASVDATADRMNRAPDLDHRPDDPGIDPDARTAAPAPPRY
ncbi:heme biosynthesis protein HemY [Futiania mangrovi]|uniref:Tetratricopeptide repeat protein n=1 Tax=Futiania mangrovi TaxID=2959716 RepID=A0A9J6PKJ8_9PROT|nr:heme biosynthesis HemY N-terminal domain-containing protein [Futiania mangrovii]MCP1336594.1 tetratricopeptide repeat protein [Futiania mangrovii]